MQDWPHQPRCVEALLARASQGGRRVCLTVPTGGGKTRIVGQTIERLTPHGWFSVVYTNRRLLIDQLSGFFDDHGIEHGVRAADYPDERDRPVQLSSLPTEYLRTLEEKAWSIHGIAAGAKCIVFLDEAHINTGNNVREILDRHAAHGHTIILLTATPLGLGDMHEELIVGATNTELRKCEAIVWADHYGAAEIDLRAWQDELENPDEDDERVEARYRKMVHMPALFGNVFTTWKKLNSYALPTILFAPGVPESLWFAQEFTRQGIPAAHIDGKTVWIAGEQLPANRDTRAEAFEASRTGKVSIICNRFVLREGFDAPWLEVGVLATAFGSLQTYLQSVGRLLRASPATGKQRALLIDHGGNWYRHLSANYDRKWEAGDTSAYYAARLVDAYRDGEQPEPRLCRECGRVMIGRKCPGCGHESEPTLRVRPVLQSDGTLTELTGPIHKPRVPREHPDTVQKWTTIYYRMRNAKKTFRQAYSFFAHEHYYWPPRTLPLMPKTPRGWHRLISEVKDEDLTAPYQPRKRKMK